MKYQTIVADPPWHYEAFANNPKPGLGGTAPLPYSSLTLDEIRRIPVADLAATDCRLFMWTTNKYLGEAFGVLNSWGFRYTQTLVWHKTGNPSPFGGSVAPNHAEYILVGRRGTPAVVSRMSSSVVAAPVTDHSVKPECFLDYIEAVSEPPYVELFARRARFGWDYWGNQSLGTAQLGELHADTCH